MDEVRWIVGGPPPPRRWRNWLVPLFVLVPAVVGCAAILYLAVCLQGRIPSREGPSPLPPPPLDHLVELLARVEPLIDRSLLLTARPGADEDSITGDPVFADLKRGILTYSSVLLESTLPPEDADDARALRSFVTGAPLPVSTSPLPCSLWALRLLLQGDPQRAYDVVCGCREDRWGNLVRWVRAHVALAHHRAHDPFESAPSSIRGHLDSLPNRFRQYAVYWIDCADACEDPEDAEKCLANACYLAPDEPAVLLRQADLAERRGNRELARQLRGHAKEVEPDPVTTLVARVLYLEGRGDGARTRSAYDELFAQPAAPPAARRHRAAFLLRTGKPAEALADAEFAYAAERTEVALALLADALTACRRPQEALDCIEGSSPVLRSPRSRALRALGRIEEALSEAISALDFGEAAACCMVLGRVEDADKFATQDTSALASEVAAQIALSRGHVEDASAWNDRAIEADPLRASCYARRGALLLRQDRLSDATAAFWRATDIDPSCWEAWRGLAEMRHRQGNVESAMDALGRVPESAPRDAGFYVLRARLRTAQGFLRDAVGDLDEAIRLEPSPFFLLLDRAELKLELQDYAGARADAELAKSRIRRASQPWKLIALADLAEGKADEAEKGFDEAIRRSPRDGEARLARATLRLVRKDRVGAREDLVAAGEAELGSTEALWRLLQIDVEDRRWEDVRTSALLFLGLYEKDERAAQVRRWLDDARAALR